MRYSEKKKRSKKERVGFFTALSICVIAVGMAAYSTYTSLTGVFDNDDNATLAVNNIVTGVTETEKPTTAPPETTESVTEPRETETEDDYEEETAPKETKSAIETMVTVNSSLAYPLEWQAHTGVDFACDEGDNVYSMGDGEVKRIYKDDILGKTIVVKAPTYTAYYSGMSENVKVEKGSVVKAGDVLATAGSVPGESLDGKHIHIAVKVKGQYTDPLSLISNDE